MRRLQLSNTRRLIEVLGYSGVLIEDRSAKFAELRRRSASSCQSTPTATKLAAFVALGKEMGYELVCGREWNASPQRTTAAIVDSAAFYANRRLANYLRG